MGVSNPSSARLSLSTIEVVHRLVTALNHNLGHCRIQIRTQALNTVSTHLPPLTAVLAGKKPEAVASPFMNRLRQKANKDKDEAAN
jgi:hypothetical protein